MPPAESEPFVGKARCWLRGRECVLGGDSLLKHHSLPQKGPVPERGSLGNAWVVESSLLLGTLGALGGLLLGEHLLVEAGAQHGHGRDLVLQL